VFKILFYTHTHTHTHTVSGTNHINPCVQVEDVKLNRKVLYHFAIIVIVNEILIFENCRKEACLAGKCKRLARYAPSASLSARGVVYSNGYARYARAAVSLTFIVNITYKYTRCKNLSLAIALSTSCWFFRLRRALSKTNLLSVTDVA